MWLMSLNQATRAKETKQPLARHHPSSHHEKKEIFVPRVRKAPSAPSLHSHPRHHLLLLPKPRACLSQLPAVARVRRWRPRQRRQPTMTRWPQRQSKKVSPRRRSTSTRSGVVNLWCRRSCRATSATCRPASRASRCRTTSGPSHRRSRPRPAHRASSAARIAIYEVHCIMGITGMCAF